MRLFAIPFSSVEAHAFMVIFLTVEQPITFKATISVLGNCGIGITEFVCWRVATSSCPSPNNEN